MVMRCWAWKEGIRARARRSSRMESTVEEANLALKESVPMGAPRTRVPSWEKAMSDGNPILTNSGWERVREGANMWLLSLRSSPWRFFP